MDEAKSVIQRVLHELQPVIREAVASFPRGIAEGSKQGEDGLAFFLQSESTSIRTMLVYLEDSETLVRRDVLDLNVPDVIFELAGQRREDSLETHDFVYHSLEEAVSAYRHWFEWAIDLLRREYGIPSKQDGGHLQ